MSKERKFKAFAFAQSLIRQLDTLRERSENKTGASISLYRVIDVILIIAVNKSNVKKKSTNENEFLIIRKS